MTRTSRLLSGAFSVLWALLFLAPAPLNADILLQDGFEDGDRTDGADPADTAWFLVGQGDVNQTATVGPDEPAPGGLGPDNVLFVEQTGTRAFQMGRFPEATLAPGQYIRLTFKVRFTRFAMSGNDLGRDAFRFGIMHDAGTFATEDGNKDETVGDDYGYFATIAAAPDQVSRLFVNNPQAENVPQANSPFRITSLSDQLQNLPVSPFAIVDTSPRTYVLTVAASLKSPATTLVTLQADHGEGLEMLMSGEDTHGTGGDPHFTFNYVVFGSASNAGFLDYKLDDIVVETGSSICSSIPPVSIARPLAAGSNVVLNNLLPGTEKVHVYVNGQKVKTVDGAPPATPATMTIGLDSPLVAGDSVYALQEIGGVESCFPVAYPTIVDRCEDVAGVSVRFGLAAGGTSVTVHDVDPAATQVSVYANGQAPPIGTAPGNGGGIVVVTVPPLVKGDVISATQTVPAPGGGTVEGCIPAGGVPVQGTSTLLVDETFGDGDRDNDGVLDDPDGSGFGVVDNADEVGVAWYQVNVAANAQTMRVAHDPDGLGADNALFCDNNRNQTYQLANFPRVTLRRAGDSIKLTVTMRCETIPNYRDAFRAGLFTRWSDQTWILEDHSSLANVYDDAGYFATVATGASEDTALRRKRIAKNRGPSGTTTAGLFAVDYSIPNNAYDGSTDFLVNDQAPHTIELTISRTASDTVFLEYKLDGQVVRQGEDTDPKSPPVFTFDEVATGNGASGSPAFDYWIDDIRVETSVIPCVDPVFNLIDDGRVDELDLQAFEDCATGPTPPAGVFDELPTACKCLDANEDGAIDQQDFGIFQRCYTGSIGTIDPACDD